MTNAEPDEELLSAYLDGELAGDARAHVERRLEIDDTFRQCFDDFRSLRDAIQDLPRVSLSDDFRSHVLERIQSKKLTRMAEAPSLDSASTFDNIPSPDSADRAGSNPSSPRDDRSTKKRLVRIVVALAASILMLLAYPRLQSDPIRTISKAPAAAGGLPTPPTAQSALDSETTAGRVLGESEWTVERMSQSGEESTPQQLAPTHTAPSRIAQPSNGASTIRRSDARSTNVRFGTAESAIPMTEPAQSLDDAWEQPAARPADRPSPQDTSLSNPSIGRTGHGDVSRSKRLAATTNFHVVARDITQPELITLVQKSTSMTHAKESHVKVPLRTLYDRIANGAAVRRLTLTNTDSRYVVVRTTVGNATQLLNALDAAASSKSDIATIQVTPITVDARQLGRLANVVEIGGVATNETSKSGLSAPSMREKTARGATQSARPAYAEGLLRQASTDSTDSVDLENAGMPIQIFFEIPAR